MMKRRSNLWVWAGFLVAVVAVVSYYVFFCRFPVTRDFPWANLLLFAAGGWLLAVGLRRAFHHPELYRGTVSGPILSVLSVLVFGLFLFSVFYLSKQLPGSPRAPRFGQKAPDFTLLDKDSNPVTLSKLLASPANSGASRTAKTNGAVLIFYRGYW